MSEWPRSEGRTKAPALPWVALPLGRVMPPDDETSTSSPPR